MKTSFEFLRQRQLELETPAISRLGHRPQLAAQEPRQPS